jgi:hypothetical protein
MKNAVSWVYSYYFSTFHAINITLELIRVLQSGFVHVETHEKVYLVSFLDLRNVTHYIICK